MAFDMLALPIGLLIVLSLWELVWKGIALWKCGRHNQLTWFILILILNTVGILPIVYLLFFQKKDKRVLSGIKVNKKSTKRKAKKRTVKKKTKKKK
ncbi:MAG: DUF5652 family protein [archaeon]